MFDKLLQHPIPNSLAVLVLISLIFTWFASILLALRDTPISLGRGWYPKTMLAFSLLGIPSVFDLLQTTGIALAFAVVASAIIVINLTVLIFRFLEKTSWSLARDWFTWGIPILALGGLSVAGYFTFLELTGAQVACGPSHGCDTVQNSTYAVLFGIIPMGMFGLAGNIAILAAWLVRQLGPVSLQKTASLSLWGFCVFGVLFSIYLTFLEPFVIGATCLWCIASAVFMMFLLLVTIPVAQEALMINEEKEVLADRT